MHPTPCGRFLVLYALHVDRDTLDALLRWAEPRGLSAQDAIQLAILHFTEHVVDASAGDEPAATAPAQVPACPRNGSTAIGSGFLPFRTA